MAVASSNLKFKFKFVVKLQNKVKTRIIFVKNESFIHMAEWILLLSVTKVSQSVQRLHPHIREDVDTSRQLRCQ